jgi:hypothetical protein
MIQVVLTWNITPPFNIVLSTKAPQTIWTLYNSYFKGITANIQLQVYSVTCC